MRPARRGPMVAHERTTDPARVTAWRRAWSRPKRWLRVWSRPLPPERWIVVSGAWPPTCRVETRTDRRLYVMQAGFAKPGGICQYAEP